MTEAEWLECVSPLAMLVSIFDIDAISIRKRRLLAVGGCSLIRGLLPDVRTRSTLDVTESHIEGLATDDQQYAAIDAAWEAVLRASSTAEASAAAAISYAASYIDNPDPDDVNLPVVFEHLLDCGVRSTVLADLVRCVVGNPFRPVIPRGEWRTSTAVSIAQGMYVTRDFSPIPLLADALQDTGCEQEDILNHCRSDGPHVRGCWVVDLVLGKS